MSVLALTFVSRHFPAMGKQSKSKKDRKTSVWFQRHVNDPHVKRAQAEGKRSRAAFKLTEILDKYNLLLKENAVVVDLGCAPGSWTQEAASRIGKAGLVVGIDLLPMQPVQGASFIQSDFDSEEGLKTLDEVLVGRKANLVLSDMAPEMSGNKLVDQMRMNHLNVMTLNFAENHLRAGGHLLLKSFMGEGYDAFRREIGKCFASVKTVKPAASRKSSSEIYLLGQSFRSGG